MNTLDFRFYISLFIKRLPLLIVIFLLFSVTGVTVAYLLSPVYRSSARILVESPQIAADLARSTVPDNAIAQIQLIEQQLTTRSNLLALADRFGIYPNRDAATLDDIVEDMRARTKVEEVQFDISRSNGGATAFSVSFEAGDPQLAARVVNEFVGLILKENVRLRTDRAGDTLQFFEQEVTRLSGELNAVESRILKFKNEHENSLPESLGFRRNQQANQQERILQLQREEAGLRSRRDNLVQMFESAGYVPGANAKTPEEQVLADLRRTLEQRRATFAENSPGILSLRTRIATLDAKVRSDKAETVAGDTGKAPSEIDMQLADIDGRLAYITEEKASIEKDLTQVSRSIIETPNNESTLNALNRNYESIKAQYASAISRRAEASTGEQIELRSKGERLSIAEPATSPQKPISPRRLAIAGSSSVAGMAVGLALIVLLEMLNRSIRRPSELVESLGIQPFTTIPYIHSRHEVRAGRIRMALTMLLITGAVVGVLLLVHTYYQPIDVLIEHGMRSIGLHPRP